MKLMTLVWTGLATSSALCAIAHAETPTIPSMDGASHDPAISVAGPSGGSGGANGGLPSQHADQGAHPQGNDCDDRAGTCVKPAPGTPTRVDVRGTVGWRTQGNQGIGLGGMTGSAVNDGKGPVPQTLQLEYFNVGSNPTTNGRSYGLRQEKLEFSGVSGGVPEMALESRGMSGWQIFRASDSRPVGFHLGIEPLNFESQITTNIYQDARNTAARIAQSKANQQGAGGQGGQVISQIGNPDGPVNREQYLYYTPMLSAGIDVRKAGCRFLALVRGGASGGGQLRTDEGYSYGIAPAWGAGVYANCAQFDVDGEWTRIQQSGAPMDLVNADVMYKPLKNIPLAIGAELGSTVTNAQDPKSVPLELPGYGVKGSEVETHASAMVRVVF